MIKKIRLLLLATSIMFVGEIQAQNRVLNFDGINDYVNIDAIAPLLAGDNTFTIEFIMKADLSNQTSSIRTSMFGINQNGNGFNRLLIVLGGATSQTGQLMIYTTGANAPYISSQIIGDNNCHHIAVSVNNNFGSVFIDGILDGTFNFNTTLLATDSYSLGQEYDQLYSTSQFYNGDLDEVRIWSTTKTQAEIQNNMNNELVGNETNLAAYYNCNQGVSAGNNISEVSLTNTSVNTGLNGQFNGFALNGFTSNFILKTCSNICLEDSTSFSVESCDAYTWNLNNYTQSGYYIDTLLNSNGCDSIVTLDLTINHSIYVDSVVTTCDSYNWNGIIYTQSGIYTDSSNTINGCDSIITLDLTINYSTIDSLFESACNSYEWNNNSYTETGIYTDTLQGLNGCDSIVVLNLTITNYNNNSLNFDGIDDYVNISSVASHLATDSSFTIEFIMKADFNNQTSSIRTTMFGINQAGNGFNRLLIILGGNSAQTGQLMIYTTGANAPYISSQIIGDNNCHHIAVSVNNNFGSVFIDGILDGTFNFNTTLQTTDSYSLGQEYDQLYTPSQFYKGDLDEVRIWSTTKTQIDIQNNMNNELIGNEIGLIAYYKCNQGVGAGNNLSEVSLTNSSVNTGLNGPFNGFALNGSTSNFILNACCSKNDSTNSISEITSNNIQMTIYPNPANSIINIQLLENNANNIIRIFDFSGKLVTNYSSNINDNLVSLDINNLENGVYLITIVNHQTNEVKQAKFVKM